MSDRLAALDAFLEDVDAALDDEPGAHDSAVRVGAIFERHAAALRDVGVVSSPDDVVSDGGDAGPTSPRVVFGFGLGEEGARWNWPVDGHDGIDAFREILTLAGIDFDEVAGPSSVAAAEGEREIVTAEAALEMLAVVDDYDAGDGPEQCVHTFRQGVAGILLGAHWSLEKVNAEIAAHDVELSGPAATAMGHGLVLQDENGAVFLATKEAG